MRAFVERVRRTKRRSQHSGCSVVIVTSKDIIGAFGCISSLTRGTTIAALWDVVMLPCIEQAVLKNVPSASDRSLDSRTTYCARPVVVSAQSLVQWITAFLHGALSSLLLLWWDHSEASQRWSSSWSEWLLPGRFNFHFSSLRISIFRHLFIVGDFLVDFLSHSWRHSYLRNLAYVSDGFFRSSLGNGPVPPFFSSSSNIKGTCSGACSLVCIHFSSTDYERGDMDTGCVPHELRLFSIDSEISTLSRTQT